MKYLSFNLILKNIRFKFNQIMLLFGPPHHVVGFVQTTCHISKSKDQ